tara:strand:+ start:62484 stop:63416 length:933 start_codon:yes stop_codon:yes gene_type:complete
LKAISNELKIGLVILVATVVAFFGFKVMKNEPFFSQAKLLYVKYDSVDGLIKGSSVTLNGYQIGSVRQMDYIEAEDSIQVTINIKTPVSIPAGSVARLQAPFALGSSTIVIEKSDSKEMLPWDSYLRGTKKEGLLDTIKDKGESISDSAEVALSLVNEKIRALTLIDSANMKGVETTLDNFKDISSSLQEVVTGRQKEIDSMIVDARSLMKNMDDLSGASKEDLESFISNLEAFSQRLDTLGDNLDETTTSINSILAKIDTGEGTLGKMVNDPSLYQNLDSLTVNLNELIKGIQSDPKRYLKHMRLVEVF